MAGHFFLDYEPKNHAGAIGFVPQSRQTPKQTPQTKNASSGRPKPDLRIHWTSSFNQYRSHTIEGRPDANLIFEATQHKTLLESYVFVLERPTLISEK